MLNSLGPRKDIKLEIDITTSKAAWKPSDVITHYALDRDLLFNASQCKGPEEGRESQVRSLFKNFHDRKPRCLTMCEAEVKIFTIPRTPSLAREYPIDIQIGHYVLFSLRSELARTMKPRCKTISVYWYPGITLLADARLGSAVRATCVALCPYCYQCRYSKVSALLPHLRARSPLALPPESNHPPLTIIGPLVTRLQPQSLAG